MRAQCPPRLLLQPRDGRAQPLGGDFDQSAFDGAQLRALLAVGIVEDLARVLDLVERSAGFDVEEQREARTKRHNQWSSFRSHPSLSLSDRNCHTTSENCQKVPPAAQFPTPPRRLRAHRVPHVSGRCPSGRRIPTRAPAPVLPPRRAWSLPCHLIHPYLCPIASR